MVKKKIAQLARQYEQSHKYMSAMLQWKKLAKLFKHPINKKYAEDRADFCKQAAVRQY